MLCGAFERGNVLNRGVTFTPDINIIRKAIRNMDKKLSMSYKYYHSSALFAEINLFVLLWTLVK